MNRPLRVFLCHSSNDKPAVRELYQKLRAEPWIQPWLDEEELYPGQGWNMEIEKAVEAADAIIVCLSKGSINKEGYVQRELRIVLDYADYKPEGTLYIMPVRLEECVPPRRLRPWQYADYIEGQRELGLQRLLVSLKRRADSLGLKFKETISQEAEKLVVKEQNATEKYLEDFHKKYARPLSEYAIDKITLSNGMEFMRVPTGKFLMGSEANNELAHDREKPQHTVNITYDCWMARFPITNELYNVWTESSGIKHPVKGWKKKKDHPVVDVSWNDAMEYCKWLNNMLKTELPSGLVLRLPTEAEWEKGARGTDGREWPWGNDFGIDKCNTAEVHKSSTTSVGSYSPRGDSLYGCADMAGNVREWTHSLMEDYPYKADDGREDEKSSRARVLRGGSFFDDWIWARCASRDDLSISTFYGDIVSFRVAVAPKLS